MIKTLLRKAAACVGYEIRKAPLPGFLPARIFDLVVQYVILTRGESLRFIQVGANDGRYGDPLRRYVLKYPWKGILVEPQPEVYEALKLNYAGLEDRLFFENVAISTDAGGMTLYRARNTFEREGEATRYAASVASSDRRVTSKQLGLSPHDLEKVEVPTARLDDLVSKYAFEDFELLQIDTEGHDWHVLQTLDLSRVRPLVIQFEHGHLRPKELGRAVAHLNSHGYLVYYGGHQSDTLALRSDVCEA
jgi:FkbM family methyltransferase